VVGSLRLESVALFIAVVFVSAACSSPPSESPAEQDRFQDLLAQTLIEAELGGASEAQIEALKSAKLSGGIDFEPMASAARETIDCLNDSGFIAEYNVDQLPGDVDFPNYIFRGSDESLSPDEVEELAATCERRHFSYISYIFQIQPTVVEAVDSEFEAGRDRLVTCLESNGVDTSELHTQSELVEAAIRLFIPDVSEGNQEMGVDCMAEAGIRAG
jgi:hypothetical protein